MSEINLKNAWKVDITEYESGWGQRHVDTKYYDNEFEATQFCLNHNRDNPGSTELFYRATMSKV